MNKTYSITYSVERFQWELWQTTKSERAIDDRCIFEGTKKECQDRLKEIKKNRK